MKQYKIAIDDNILVKDKIYAAESGMLSNFKSPYSATVVEKMQKVGAELVSAQISGQTQGLPLHNEADVALGIDVDGSAYRSAVKTNTIYIKPTYGTVSRFGVVANVSSVDQIGVYAKNFDDGFEVLSAIAGHDKNDGTSYPTEKYEYSPDKINKIDVKSLKAAKLNGFYGDSEEPFDERINNIGIPVDSIDFKLADYLAQVYLIISTAEFSNNISRFDGLKFGYRTENFRDLNDMITNSRSESFTAETKIKSLMGTYVLSEEQFKKYYYKATQIRRLIKEELDEIFKQYDFVITHISDFSDGSGFSDAKGYYNNLKFSALANLTGCPSITVPVTNQHGVQIIAREFDENKLYALGKSLL